MNWIEAFVVILAGSPKEQENGEAEGEGAEESARLPPGGAEGDASPEPE